MPRTKPPKYRKHSQGNYAFVEFKGKRQRLPGEHNSTESKSAYKSFLVRNGFVKGEATEKAGTLADLYSKFLPFALSYYEPGGSTLAYRHKLTAKLLIGRSPNGFGAAHMSIDDFGPKMFREWIEWLIDKQLGRVTINQYIRQVKFAYKWAVSEELIDAIYWHRLHVVPSLPKGRTRAKDYPKRQPVSWSQVEPVLCELREVQSAMLFLQWLTGARSTSICEAKPEQFQPDGNLLIWRPRHKNEHLDQELVIPVGPIGRLTIAPFMDRKPTAYMFCSREHRRMVPKGLGLYCYSAQTYWTAITKGQELAGVKHWTPHQLRHARGHFIRNEYGAEAAQAILGHESLKTTEHYSSKRLDLAREVAAVCG